MDKKQLLGIVRHGLTFLGGMLLMKGLISSEEWNEISGAVITAVGGIWSIIDKVKA